MPLLEIRRELRGFGVELSEFQAGQVQGYIDILLQWNQSLNLTAITDPHEILERHFFESMFAAKIADFSHGRLADVGSGAGFPGLALKILCPDLRVTLIESNLKKCAFLREVIRRIGVFDCQVFHGRLESYPGVVEMFNFVTARAFGQFQPLLRWAGGALVPAGKVVLWIGAKDAATLRLDSSWTWGAPASIPRSDRRVIAVGSR